MNQSALFEEELLNIYAVVVNWNRPLLTIECLRSLQNQEALTAQMIVVDNASNDDSVKEIRTAFPQARILKTNENLGYAPAANLGIQVAMKSGAEFVLLLNNDAIADNGMLQNLLRFYQSDVGILAPAVYCYDQPERLWSAGGMLRPWILERTEDAEHWASSDIMNIPVEEKDFVTGCCMLISASIFKYIGFFDERFRMYYDDADFCHRVRLGGFRILLVKDAKAWHRVAASSSGKDTPNERYWMAKSSVLFFRKHATRLQSLLIFPYRTGSTIKTIFGLLIKGKMKSARAYLTGLWDGLRY